MEFSAENSPVRNVDGKTVDKNEIKIPDTCENIFARTLNAARHVVVFSASDGALNSICASSGANIIIKQTYAVACEERVT